MCVPGPERRPASLTGTYLVTAADVLAGEINNIGTGDTDQTDPNTESGDRAGTESVAYDGQGADRQR